MKRLVPFAVLLGVLIPSTMTGQASYFAGGFGGFSLLSADAVSRPSADFSQTSQYSPKPGPDFQVFGGRHLSDYISFQGSYGWNRNRFTLSATEFSGDEFAFFEQERRATTQSVIGEGMLYFRKRGSFARPYLTLGAGFVRVSSGAGSIERSEGSLPALGGFSSTAPAVRIAVGIDLFFKGGWGFRYSFSETVRKNPIGERMTPPGSSNLKNFENLFGFVKYF